MFWGCPKDFSTRRPTIIHGASLWLFRQNRACREVLLSQSNGRPYLKKAARYDVAQWTPTLHLYSYGLCVGTHTAHAFVRLC